MNIPLLWISGWNFWRGWLRKVMMFMWLCLLMNISLYYTRGKYSPAFAVVLTSLYAATDEIHQLFVEGRACKISDWAIDTAGAAIGAAAFLLIAFAVTKIVGKRKNVDRGNN